MIIVSSFWLFSLITKEQFYLHITDYYIIVVFIFITTTDLTFSNSRAPKLLTSKKTTIFILDRDTKCTTTFPFGYRLSVTPDIEGLKRPTLGALSFNQTGLTSELDAYAENVVPSLNSAQRAYPSYWRGCLDL